MTLMTPSAATIAAGTPCLGLPDRDFVLVAPWVGGRVMPDKHHFDYFPKWFGDAQHLARTMRRNLCYETRSLVFLSLPNGAQRCAEMQELIELQNAAPRGEQRSFRYLTEIVQINKWRDQKGDAAYEMLKASTIEHLKKYARDI
jgi:hypothetical protein